MRLSFCCVLLTIASALIKAVAKNVSEYNSGSGRLLLLSTNIAEGTQRATGVARELQSCRDQTNGAQTCLVYWIQQGYGYLQDCANCIDGLVNGGSCTAAVEEVCDIDAAYCNCGICDIFTDRYLQCRRGVSCASGTCSIGGPTPNPPTPPTPNPPTPPTQITSLPAPTFVPTKTPSTFSPAPTFAPTKKSTDSPQASQGPRLSLVEQILQNFNLQLLEAYVNFGRVANNITGNDAQAMMMPWDTAMENIDGDIETKLRNPAWNAHLRNFLLFHLHNADLPASSLDESNTVTMANGQDVIITRQPGTSRVRVNDIIVIAQYDATNGFAYMLDEPLRPVWFDATLLDVVSGTPFLSTWTSYVVSEGLDTELLDMAESLTVFAPSNDAFSQLDPSFVSDLQSTLYYHVAVGGPYSLYPLRNAAMSYPYKLQASTLAGPGVELIVSSQSVVQVVGLINDATIDISQEDYLVAYNGLVHVIDQVLLLENEPTGEKTKEPTGEPTSMPVVPVNKGSLIEIWTFDSLYHCSEVSQGVDQQQPNSKGTIFADGTCRTTNVLESSLQPPGLQLPGTYSALCVVGTPENGDSTFGVVEMWESGCLDASCARNLDTTPPNVCDRDFSSVASLYSRLSPPGILVVQDPALRMAGFFRCDRFDGQNGLSVAFAVFGKCNCASQHCG